MEEGNTWTSLFFSGNCPKILETNELPGNHFRPFGPEDGAEDDDWNLGRKVDISRNPDPKTIQVFWLRIKGRSKYIAKVFPGYSKEDAKIQLCRINIRPTTEIIDDAIYNFDRFYREARAYSHIDMLCSVRERIYFPQFHGVITNMSRSRFSSGYCHERAVVLEPIKPALSSRRVLVEHVEDANIVSMSFLAILESLSLEFFTAPEIIPLSPFEQHWYHSLMKDRLRRLNTLHRIGITHGDIHDHHFRLPNDIYDTVLYDFSEAYTFSKKQPFRVNHGRPRPLSAISEGERGRVIHHIRDRAISRDLRSYLIRDADSKHTSSPDNTACVDNALWQFPDKEIELLELIMLKVSFRPDGFSMPTLNSIFPFLEAVCPRSDICWHIRRARLLCHYKSVWAVFRDAQPAIIFDCEPQFGTIETMKDSRFMLCLIPNSWIESLTKPGFSGFHKLRTFCSSFLSAKSPGAILELSEFWKEAESTEMGTKES